MWGKKESEGGGRWLDRHESLKKGGNERSNGGKERMKVEEGEGGRRRQERKEGGKYDR